MPSVSAKLMQRTISSRVYIHMQLIMMHASRDAEAFLHLIFPILRPCVVLTLQANDRMVDQLCTRHRVLRVSVELCQQKWLISEDSGTQCLSLLHQTGALWNSSVTRLPEARHIDSFGPGPTTVCIFHRECLWAL